MTIKKIFLLFFLAVLTHDCFTQEILVSAKIDSSKILIGDFVKLNVIVNAPLKTTVVWPELKDEWTDYLSVLNKTGIDSLKENDSLKLRRSYTITCYDSGSFYIPSISFKYKNPEDTAYQFAFTDSILLDVKTVAVDTTKAIKDIKGPISVPYDVRALTPYIIGVLAIAALIFVLIYYLKKRKKGVKFLDFSKPAPPAHEVALKALEDLKNRKLWQNNKVKEYYTELTEIIRTYIENRFTVAALEMTSDEIITAFRGIDISNDLKTKISQLFILADLVKFAKASPLPNEHDLSFYNAQSFVRETIPVTVPENPEGFNVPPDKLNHKEDLHV